jgi:hypothetical protein
MPLPPSSIPRQRLHQREVSYEGFMRDDGLVDIDAHLVDAKDHDYELLTGVRPAREAVHDMWARVTIDRRFVIHAIDVHTDSMPYPDACDRIEPVYSKLIGANLLQGFRKRLHDDMGGVRGCTHVTELLGALSTAAVQRSRACSGRTPSTASPSSSTTATRWKRRPTPFAAIIRSGIGVPEPGMPEPASPGSRGAAQKSGA